MSIDRPPSAQPTVIRLLVVLVALGVIVAQPLVASPMQKSHPSLKYPPGVTNSTAACNWFIKWERAQANERALGEVYESKVHSRTPRVHDRIGTATFDDAAFKDASTFRTPGGAGSGLCGSVWSDSAHHIAETLAYADSTRDTFIFRTTSNPVGVTEKDLSQIKTLRGIRLGMSRQQVEAILGPAATIKTSKGTAIHYSWTGGRGVPVYDLRILFTNNQVVGIDYNWGV